MGKFLVCVYGVWGEREEDVVVLWNACVYVWIIHSDIGVLSVWL